MCEMKKRHQCELIPDTGVQIFQTDYRGSGESDWCLRAFREATEDDLLENHHLEELGELIEYADIGIECCPFCGQKLDENREAEKRAQVSFSYVDCSRWS